MLKVIIIFLFRLLLLANALTKSINLKVINLLRRILYKINAVRKPKFCLTLTSEFSVNLCISLQTKGLPRQLYWYIDFRYNTAIARLFFKKKSLLKILEVKVCTCTRNSETDFNNLRNLNRRDALYWIWEVWHWMLALFFSISEFPRAWAINNLWALSQRNSCWGSWNLQIFPT